MEKKLEEFMEWKEEREEGIKTIIGGDFNSRQGEKEGEYGGWGRRKREGKEFEG